jgi:hypothetical protein
VKLKIIIENNIYAVEIPEDVMRDGGSFFEKLDADMDKGWQMNREWVETPNLLQRCQIVADRIADAINNENETLTYLLAGFIVTRMPNVKEVRIDTNGEMSETEFITS